MKVKVYSMPYGLMVIWDKVDEAMRYFVHLKVTYFGANGGTDHSRDIKTINDIKIIEVERNQLFYSFDKLAYLSNTSYHENRYGGVSSSWTDYYECKNYFVSVEAENKEGNIVDKSDDIIGLIEYGTKREIDWRK